MALRMATLLLDAIAAIGILYTLAAALIVPRWRPAPVQALPDPPAISLLKPLHGSEPRLADNLAGFLDQGYRGSIQMVCGVASAEDPALRQLGELRGDERIVVAIDDTRHGANGKVSNLINMMPGAAHELLVLSDSDIAVAPDYLDRVAAALAAPGVGAVTCLYAGRGDAGFWSRIAAAGISWQFLPSVMVGLALGLAKPCMGSTIAMRRQTLDSIGGFAAFADTLADDHAIGAAVRAHGLRVAVPAMLVTHGCAERSLIALIRHELRWNATVRGLDPAGFAGSIVTHPLALALIALLLSGGTWPALLVVAAALAARLLLAWRIDGLAERRTAPLWLLPLRDLLSFGLFMATFVVRSVDWRGTRLRMGSGGKIAADVE